MATFVVDPRAYAAIGLHAFRYPHANLLGFLLGTRTTVRCVHSPAIAPCRARLRTDASLTDRARTAPSAIVIPLPQASVRVTTAVPLFHTHTLAPMLEVAALLAQQHCEEKGLEIVGCYFASERLEAGGAAPPVTDVVKSVAATIRKNLQSSALGANGCLILAVDGNKLGNPDALALACYTYKDRWALLAPVDVANAAECNALLDAQLGNAMQLVDFDEHLDDASRDFLNPWLK
jgi:hypothetical protein